MSQPWDPGYKPPSPAEAFDPQRPLPNELVAGIAIDWSHQERSNRAEGLEDALELIITKVQRDEFDPLALRDIAIAALREFRR
jgi:hypothetical protein